MRISSVCGRLVALAAVVVWSSGCDEGTVAPQDDLSPSMAVAGGNAQTGVPGEELAAPLVVRVTNDRGHGIRDQLVNFRVVDGGGSMYAGAAITDKDGYAADWWTLGMAGAQRVEVRAVFADGAKVVYAEFTATFGAPPEPQDADGDGYSIAAGDCNDANAAIHPGAEDRPDVGFVDSNCDTIDGDESRARFVAPSGTDDATCGTRSAPCRTVAIGLQRAQAAAMRDVYVAEGAYAESVELVSGVSVYGGYAAGFAVRNPALHHTTLTGAPSLTVSSRAEPVVLLASGITGTVEVADLRIVGLDAAGAVSGIGRNSYAVFITNVAAGVLTLTRNHIVAGAGAPGTAGANGADASQTQPAAGANGSPSALVGGICDNTSRGSGGSAGTNPSNLGGNGGAGGLGGTADTDCNILSLNLNARPGSTGFFAATAGSGYGFPGSGGGVCAPGQPGQNGRTTHGENGAAAAAGNTVGGIWLSGQGSAGSLGLNATGGAGGGGGGGCDSGTDAFGAGGGGGGAGGARAPSAGLGGGGGGSSFAVYVLSAAPAILSNTIVRGAGGAGGAGGDGGRGQPGSPGGNGGAGTTGGAGGHGGDGGTGGHSGGGGGGAGGRSAGIMLVGSASATVDANVITGGAGGAGGMGGLLFGGARALSGPAGSLDMVAGG